MKDLRMTVTAVHITYDSLECAISRSDGQMISRQLTHYIRLKQMIKTANFHGMGNLQVKLQLIACGSGLFSICIDVSEGKQFCEEQQSDKELFNIAVDSTEMKFALVGADQLEKIRSFGPKFERLLYAFNDSHKKVTSITTHLNSPAIVSEVSEGQVRLWKLCRDCQQLKATMKEHIMAVTAVWVTQNDLECVSSGSDGQMLTWLLTRHIRLKQMIKTANFQDIENLQDNSQFIACGSDRFTTYFDVFGRNKLHEVKLSDKELFNIAVDLSEIQFALVDVDQLNSYFR
ncbi:MAG: putative flagellar associated protein, partial [Streblomastix strix]